MAIKLSANYSKKLGLPQYSSHSFSASVEVELTDISQVEQEIQKLYELLQHSVDQEIQNVGFIPQANGSTATGTVNTTTVAPTNSTVTVVSKPMVTSSLALMVIPGTALMVNADSSCASSVTTRWTSRKPKICPFSSSVSA
jgi:hypothetical protein